MFTEFYAQEIWLAVNLFNSFSINLKKMRESQQDNMPLFCKQKFFKSKVYNHSFFSAFKIIMKFRQQYKSAWCGPRKTHWRVQWGRLQRGEYIFETILESSKHIFICNSNSCNTLPIGIQLWPNCSRWFPLRLLAWWMSLLGSFLAPLLLWSGISHWHFYDVVGVGASAHVGVDLMTWLLLGSV